MNKGVLQLIALAGGFTLGWLAVSFLPLAVSNQEYHRLREQQTKCREARVHFFDECMKSALRESCEVQWASLRDHIFDGDPRNYIADEIDCNKK